MLLAMSTVLIADRFDPYALSVQRCSPWTRLRARIGSFELDVSLAEGASPDSSVPLSLRARALHSSAKRRRLARSFRKLVAKSYEPRRPFESHVPLARSEIVESQALVEELIELLESGDPLDVTGIARAALLLTESSSPLYRPSVAGALEPALTRVIETLATQPEVVPASD
jgi:hypothetical protein